ncbi:proline-rich protein 11 [Colossoma macropomum]|uniref:proline-rich protein 11 n=1 Tax=Colossoma macropomum TaxID=42526 RepID=UPI001865506A|nr:proline-rich protein 11 [Colossoma macropomum]
MAEFGRLSRVFHKRRKKPASSRRWALRAKKSVTPVSGSQVDLQSKLNPNDKTKMEPTVEPRDKDGAQLLTSSRKVVFFHAVGSIVQQCQHSISQIWTGFWNVFLFWRAYSQRVEILHQRVEDLQRELHLLHANMAKGPRSSCCHCAPSGGGRHPQSSVDPPTALPLPPPPPPPPLLPPPPAPPLPPAKKTPQKLSFIPKKRTVLTTLQEKIDRRVAVTLQDLQAVQLRKVTVNRKVRVSPDRRKAPLVTLADLQKVRLKRTQCSLPSPLRPGLAKSPNKSPMKLRVQLKKVHIDRTPGGSPQCNKENVEDFCISAITSQALVNKPQIALPTAS